ncbi:MAG: Xaa-Pro peptidase family protein [Planctomycetes bacterium]|nr:Xaa-Pro peptidase family protein [Planctomycetota bacterium]
MTQQRIEGLRRELRRQKLPSLLITSPHNVTYLTGFTGEDSFLFVDPTSIVIWSDARYEEQLQEECPTTEVMLRKPSEQLMPTVARWLVKNKVSSVHVESASTSLAQWESLCEIITPIQVHSCSGIVERLRERKDDQEILAIERAIGIAQKSFIATTSMMHGDFTEKNVADSLENNIRQLGGQGSAFKTIVGVGARASLPHGRPSSRKLQEDHFVLIDWGAKENLYMSDLTRVVITGKPTPKLQKVYQVVLNAQQAAIRAIRPGVLMSEVDRIARTIIEQAGFGKRFTHSLGHSFGLQIHESIRLAGGQDRPLETDMVVTVEPGIYIPGSIGVRIEDDVLVTKDGNRVLSSLPKEWDEIYQKS